jgi:hypothetical protein
MATLSFCVESARRLIWINIVRPLAPFREPVERDGRAFLAGEACRN